MDDLSVNVEFLINNPEVAKAAAQVKTEIQGIELTAQKAADRVSANMKKVEFSDSIKEVETYKKALNGLGVSTTASSGKAELIKLLNADLKAGIITAKQFEAELARIAALKNTGVSPSGIPTSKAGLLGSLTTQRDGILASRDLAPDIEKLGIYNAKLQAINLEIKKLTNAGKSGFDDMGNKLAVSLERPVGKFERLKVAAEMYKNASQSATNPDIIAKYNRKLAETQAELEKTSNVGKEGFDEVGNSIAESGGNALTKLFPALNKVAQILPGIGIAGLLAFAITPIMDYIARLDLLGTKAGELEKATSKVNDALASSEYTAAVKNVNELTVNIGLAKDGFLDKGKVLNQYNETIGKTTGEVNSLDAAEKALVKNGDAYIQVTLLKAAAQLSLEEAAKKAFEAAQERNKSDADALGTFDNYVLSNPKLDAERKKAAQIRRTEASNERTAEQREFEKIAKKFQADAAKLSKQNKFDFFGGSQDGSGSKTDAAVNAAESLQQRISDINDEYSRKSQSRDEAEIQAVRDKFKKLADEVAKFNADPKHTVKVDGSGLNKVQSAAIADLTYKQDTAKLAISLEEQKTLYADFEKYKVTFGEEKAIERYKNELDTSKTYLQKIKENQALTLAQASVFGITGGIDERLKLVTTIGKKEEDLQVKHQEELIAEFVSYSEMRERKQREYLEKAKSLREAGHIEEANNAIKEGVKQVNDLDDINTQKLGTYKKLFDGIEKLSTKEARRVVSEAEKMVKDLQSKGKISADLAAKILDKLTGTSKAISERLPKSLVEMASELNNIAGIVGDVNSGFAEILSTVADVSGQLGNIFRSAADFKASKSAADKLQSGLGIISAGLAIVKTVNNFLDRETKADKERADGRALELKQTEALTRALERQLAVADKAYGTKKIEEYQKAIDEASAAIDKNAGFLGERKQLTGDTDLDGLIEKVNNGEKLDNWTWWGITDKEYYDAAKSSLKGISTDVKELQSLIDNGMLDANTAKIAENYIKATDAIESAKNAMAEFNTATTFENIADGIIELFAKGNAAAEDFGDNFEEIMKKAILNSFKTQTLAKQLQDFYNQFAELSSSGGNLTAAEITKLRAQYDKIIADGQAKFNELEQVTGVSFKPDEQKGKTDSLTGAIKGITADQADLLAGQFGGLRLAQLETNVIGKANLQSMQEQLSEVRESRLTLYKIEINTKRSADTADESLIFLKSMDNKLADSLGVQLRAAGKFGY